MNKNILVTGGLGYIGSHTCIELIAAGYTPIILDDLSNCKLSVLGRLKTITQRDEIPFVQGDVRDGNALDDIFNTYQPLAVMHFAGSKAVGESVSQPLAYYHNNVSATITLLQAMERHNINSFIFSSSATVYGMDNEPPFTEEMPTGAVTNPYGRTKFMVEEILKDIQIANTELSVTILRYFNPVGADASGMIGEDPNGIPNNLIPFISKVAVGEYAELNVFGDDYNTPDGTCLRDYIHVSDLARGHVAALEAKGTEAGTHIYNLGTGKATSVMDMIKAYQEVSGKPVPYTVTARREGDIASSYAAVDKARKDLKWTATKNINDMCLDAWRWISGHYKEQS